MVNTDIKEITMKIIQWITSLFNGPSYQDSLEYFVASKQPKNTAEVEYWIRVYDQHRKEWVI